jgi:hypothetical protein
MRSPTLALTWYLWRPHRLAVTVLVGLLLVFAGLQQVTPTGRLHDLVVMASWAWMVVGLSFAVPIFTLGHDSDYAKKSTSFPERLFTLPMHTRVLVFWPMLQGMLFVAALWIAWAELSLLPEGKQAPIWWPALMLAALLGCVQAAAWWPCELPLFRVLLTAVGVGVVAIVAGVMYGLIQGRPPAWFAQDADPVLLAGSSAP